MNALPNALLLSLAATLARAETAPGGPPWICTVGQACDADACIPLPGNVARLRLSPVDDPALIRLDGFAMEPLTVGFQPDGPAAEAVVAAGALPDDVGLVLYPNDAVMDAVGLSLHVLSTKSGVTGLSPEFAVLVCFAETP